MAWNPPETVPTEVGARFVIFLYTPDGELRFIPVRIDEPGKLTNTNTGNEVFAKTAGWVDHPEVVRKVRLTVEMTVDCLDDDDAIKFASGLIPEGFKVTHVEAV